MAPRFPPSPSASSLQPYGPAIERARSVDDPGEWGDPDQWGGSAAVTSLANESNYTETIARVQVPQLRARSWALICSWRLLKAPAGNTYHASAGLDIFAGTGKATHNPFIFLFGDVNSNTGALTAVHQFTNSLPNEPTQLGMFFGNWFFGGTIVLPDIIGAQVTVRGLFSFFSNVANDSARLEFRVNLAPRSR